MPRTRKRGVRRAALIAPRQPRPGMPPEEARALATAVGARRLGRPVHAGRAEQAGDSWRVPLFAIPRPAGRAPLASALVRPGGDVFLDGELPPSPDANIPAGPTAPGEEQKPRGQRDPNQRRTP